jgi:phosphoglycolate phosphatase
MLQLNNKKPLIVFDFDGTLVDSFDLVIKSFNRVADEYHYKKISQDQVSSIRSLNISGFFHSIVSIRKLVKEFNVPWYKIPFIIKSITYLVRSEIHLLNPIPGIKEAVQMLHDSGYRLGIVTSNSVINVEFFLKNHQFPPFDIIYPDSRIFGKNYVFNQLKKQFNLTDYELIYVGDEVRDIEAAKKSGIPIIAVSWGYNTHELLASYEPTALIDHPRELMNALSKII